MTIFGKRVSEYVVFSIPFLGLILVVGIARLALSLGGIPNSTAKWLSITAVLWIGAVYYSIRVQTSGFGSYKHLLPIYVLMSLATQAIVVPGIIIAILTGRDNIYSAPEYSFGGDGKTWIHVAAHLLLGTTVAPLLSWLVGCLIMFVTRKLTGKGNETEAAARA
jgi:hypothetical protein